MSDLRMMMGAKCISSTLNSMPTQNSDNQEAGMPRSLKEILEIFLEIYPDDTRLDVFVLRTWYEVPVWRNAVAAFMQSGTEFELAQVLCELEYDLWDFPPP